MHLCRALAKSHAVRVVSPQPWTDAVSHGRAQAEVLDGMRVDRPIYLYTPKVMRAWYDRFMSVSATPALRRAMLEFQPDCVISYWAHPDCAVAARAARRAGIPSIAMVGGSDVLILAGDNRRRQKIAAALNASDAVCVVSDGIRERVCNLGVDPAKVHRVRRGVDLSSFAFRERGASRTALKLPHDRPLVLFVGRLHPVKGLDVLIRAMASLDVINTAAQLYLVGDGPLRASLESLAHELGVQERIHFVGSVPNTDLANWYSAADLTVLPSRSEGSPNVLRESLACGTPFVASRVGGIPEIAEGTPCELVTPGSVSELAAAIARTIAKKPVIERRAALLTWEESAESLMRVVRPLVRLQPQSHGVDAELAIS